MSEDSKFKMSMLDFEMMGAGVNYGTQYAANKMNLQMQMQDIDAKIDTVKLGFIEREAQRNFQTASNISNIQASAARRGVASGSETSVDAQLVKAKRAANSDLINTMNRERSLLFNKEVAKFNEKMADTANKFSLLSSVASGAANSGVFD